VCVRLSTVMRLPWSGTIEGGLNLKLLVPATLVRPTFIPGYQNILADHTMWLSLCPYNDVGPGASGDHVVSTDIDSTNAKVSGVSHLFGRAVCAVCTQYLRRLRHKRTHTVVELNNLPVSCRQLYSSRRDVGSAYQAVAFCRDCNWSDLGFWNTNIKLPGYETNEE
jgi:hypothetical protein